MNKIITILEAEISESNWPKLREVYKKETEVIPPAIVQTFLAQNKKSPTTWRIITVWKNQEALDEYRKGVEVPTGVLIFRSVGAEPMLSIFEVNEFR